MATNRRPQKPDSYQRGGIYICNLPMQTVTETTDGKSHHRDGIERDGPHPCVVISTDDFNGGQSDSLIVIPIVHSAKVVLEQYKGIPSSWVRVITKGEPSYAVVDQIRCIDRGRCRAKVGDLAQCDLSLIEGKLQQLLFVRLQQHLQRE